MLKYYKPSPSKAYQKFEKYLPVFIELDSPIPEELSMDYEFAKYDISGLLPIPKEVDENLKETFIKYETLGWFWRKKADVYRKMNKMLEEKVEISLFPLILDHAVMVANKIPDSKEFMISISGHKRKKFWHHSLAEYFVMYKEQILLGWIRSKQKDWAFFIPEYWDETQE